MRSGRPPQSPTSTRPSKGRSTSHSSRPTSTSTSRRSLLQQYLDAVNLSAYLASLPASTPVRASVTSGGSSSGGSSSGGGDFLSCVRNRESGGNYGVYNSGGSGAAGAYQFLPGTWNSIAASSGRGDLVGVDPAQAAPADQDAMAAALYSQQGSAPWGGSCG